MHNSQQGQAEQQTAASSRSGSLRLHPLAIALGGLALLLSGAIAAWRLGDGSGAPADNARAIGSFAGMAFWVVVSYALGWLAWRGASRSVSLGNTVFASLVAMVIVGQIAQIAGPQRAGAWLPLHLGVAASGVAPDSASLAGPGLEADGDVAALLVGESRKRMELAATGLTGERAAVAKVLIETLTEYETAVHGMAQAQNRLEDAGGADLATIASRQHVLARQAAVRKLQDACGDVDTVLVGIRDGLTDRFLSAGVSPATAKQESLRLLDAFQVDAKLAFNSATADSLDVLLRLFALLEAEWGRWSFDARAGLVVFEPGIDELTVYRFNGMLFEIRDCGEQTRRLRAALLTEQEHPAGATE